MNEGFIRIIVAEPDETSAITTKGIVRNRDATAVLPISSEELGERLRAACASFSGALSKISAVGDYRLAEVEVGIEISAEGGVSFIGVSKLSGSGSLKLKFVR